MVVERRALVEASAAIEVEKERQLVTSFVTITIQVDPLIHTICQNLR